MFVYNQHYSLRRALITAILAVVPEFVSIRE